jgi:hypothetical protein
MAEGTFTLNAYVTDGDLLRHYRDRDHEGFLWDDEVVLDQDIGPWKTGTTLRQVLLDLWSFVESQL